MNLLKPLADATVECEGEHATLSEAIPHLKIIRLELKKLSEAGIGTMRKELEEQLDRYFAGHYPTAPHFNDIEANKLYTTSTLLDPRYKMRGFVSKEKAAVARSVLVNKVAQKGTTVVNREPRKKGSSKWAGLDSSESDEEHGESTDTATPTTAAEIQVDAYLTDKRIDREDDPLHYWRLREKQWPQLASLARQYLCCPIGSVSSEREFKVASDISCSKRNRLLPDNIEMLLFVKFNLRAVGYNARILSPVKSDKSDEPVNDMPTASGSGQ